MIDYDKMLDGVRRCLTKAGGAERDMVCVECPYFTGVDAACREDLKVDVREAVLIALRGEDNEGNRELLKLLLRDSGEDV